MSDENFSQNKISENDLQDKINLVGFRNVDGNSILVAKRIIKNYLRKIQGYCSNLDVLQITLKYVHESESTSKFEIKGKLMDNGKPNTAKTTDKNLFFALDKVLSKLESSIKR